MEFRCCKGPELQQQHRRQTQIQAQRQRPVCRGQMILDPPLALAGGQVSLFWQAAQSQSDGSRHQAAWRGRGSIGVGRSCPGPRLTQTRPACNFQNVLRSRRKGNVSDSETVTGSPRVARQFFSAGDSDRGVLALCRSVATSRCGPGCQPCTPASAGWQSLHTPTRALAKFKVKVTVAAPIR